MKPIKYSPSSPGSQCSPYALIFLTLLTASAAFAQPQPQHYPARPIRLVVPFAPGGNIDSTARAIAPGLTELLGQQIVIDNRGGAGGLIGTEIVAKAAPDGYTLVVGSSGVLTVAPSLYSKMPYDPLKDFTSLGLLSYVPIVLVVTPNLPAKSLKDFIALAKQRAGKMIMASAGNGTTNQLAGELFQMEAGVKFVHVPYKGSGPALVDVIGGQVDMLFDQLSASANYIKGGRLRGLALAADKRNAAVPDVPTMAESGVRNCEAGTFTALTGPAGLPPTIVTRLNAALNKTLAMSSTRDRFAAVGADVLGGSTAENDALVKTELAKWMKVAKAANIKLD
jgi:tripartite-type tricarboxylate transporter receptor subunit TctC